MDLRKIDVSKNDLMDLSPTDANSLILVGDFDEKLFVDKILQLGVKEREIKIKLEVAQTAYNELFND